MALPDKVRRLSYAVAGDMCERPISSSQDFGPF
jgi:hypothetical protein